MVEAPDAESYGAMFRLCRRLLKDERVPPDAKDEINATFRSLMRKERKKSDEHGREAVGAGRRKNQGA